MEETGAYSGIQANEAVARDAGRISGALDAAAEGALKLEAVLGALVTRLDPVLRPDEPHPVNEEALTAVSTASEVVNRIEALERTVRTLTDRILRVSDRLQV